MNMSNFDNQARPISYQPNMVGTVGVVASFMNGVYAWMCVGLMLTAIVAWVTSQNAAMRQMVSSPGVWIALVIAELGLVWVISGMIQRLSATTATALFVLYAALNGLTLSAIFLIYKLDTIGGAFLITGGTFGITSLYGFVTKRDLSGLRGILMMGLIGLILATVVNIFVASSMLYWIINYAGVLLFVGLTAYDTQKLKDIALQTQGDSAMAGRMAVYGSLVLYLDFINLMLFILRIMGDKRR